MASTVTRRVWFRGWRKTPAGSTASSSTTNFSSLTPQLLAQLNGSDTGFDPAPISSLSNTFTMDSGILPNGGEGWDLGDGVWLNVPGITNFSSAVDPDYPHIAALLADGMNESLAFQERTPVGGGGGVAAFESLWFNRHPDFVGYQIDFIRLNEYDLLGFVIVQGRGSL